MVKNNQNFVKKTFLLLKYQKLLIFLVKNLLKKLSYFSRCFYVESPNKQKICDAINIVILFVIKSNYENKVIQRCDERKTCDKNNIQNTKLRKIKK